MSTHQADGPAFAQFDASFAMPLRQQFRIGEEIPNPLDGTGQQALEDDGRFGDDFCFAAHERSLSAFSAASRASSFGVHKARMRAIHSDNSATPSGFNS